MVIKFFTDSSSLGWRNCLLDALVHWIFFVIYLMLAFVFFATVVALTLQLPFLPTSAETKLARIVKTG